MEKIFSFALTALVIASIPAMTATKAKFEKMHSYYKVDVKSRPLKVILVGDSHMVGSFGNRLKDYFEDLNAYLIQNYPSTKGIQYAMVAKVGSRPASWMKTGVDNIASPNFSKKGNWKERINSLPPKITLSGLINGNGMQSNGLAFSADYLKPDLFIFEMGSNLIPSLPVNGSYDFTNPSNVQLPMSHLGTSNLIKEVKASIQVLSTYGNPFVWVGVPSPRFPDVKKYYPSLEPQQATNAADFMKTILCYEFDAAGAICNRHVEAREFVADAIDGLHFNSCKVEEECHSNLWARKTIDHIRQYYIEHVFQRSAGN